MKKKKIASGMIAGLMTLNYMAPQVGNFQKYDIFTSKVNADSVDELNIVVQPENYTGEVGNNATFRIVAFGNELSYQWQVNSAGTWKNTTMTGALTDTLKVSILENRNGYRYRCIVTDCDGNSVTSEAVELIVGVAEPLRIDVQPENYTGVAGSKAIYKIKANGIGLTYQWQVNSTGTWKNTTMAGATTDTLSVDALTTRNGYKYRCIVTDIDGNRLTSEAAELKVVTVEPLKIESQPESYTGAAGSKAVYRVKASGTGLSYQWQVNSTGTWKNTTMTGATTDTLSVDALANRNGYKYRCIITDASGNTVTSAVAELKIAEPLKIEIQPESYTGAVGSKAVYKVKASGTGLSYQWQVNSAGTWKNTTMSGATTDTLSVDALANRNGYKYRCIITDAAGNTVTSAVAGLKIEDPLKIETQPESFTGVVGSKAVYKVKASGTGLSYQWQVNSTGTWKNTTMAGANTDTLNVDAFANRNGYKYRCIITDAAGNTVTSAVAELKIVEPLKIEIQPESYTGAVGSKAVYKVKASGTGLSYQWQVNSAGTWKNTTMTGATTDTLNVDALANRNGYKYRCIITDVLGEKVISETVDLTVRFPLAIVTNPKNVYVYLNSTASFSVNAQGEGVTYQWQYLADIDSDWTNIESKDSTTDTITVNVTEANKNYKYRCILTDEEEKTIRSKAAGFELREPAKIISQPESQICYVDETAVFNVQVADDTNVTYQWKFTADGKNWSDVTAASGKTNEHSVKVASRHNGYVYRCDINDGVKTISSDLVKLSVDTLVKGECGKTATWTFGKGVLTISGTGEMSDYSATNSPFRKLSGIKKVIIERGIRSIGKNAFAGCGLSEVSIPRNVSRICDGAFADNAGLALRIENNDCMFGKNITSSDAVISGYYGSTARVYAGKNKIEFKSLTADTTPVEIKDSFDHMQPGQTIQMEGNLQNILFYTSVNSDIATVSSTGLVTAVSEGETKIVAVAANGRSEYITVKVVAEPDSLVTTAKKTDVSINLREDKDIEIINGSGLEWYSSDSSIVKINSSDSNYVSVKAVANGEAVIFGSDYRGRNITIYVSVSTSTKDITASETVTGTETDISETWYRFVPKKSGYYVVSTEGSREIYAEIWDESLSREVDNTRYNLTGNECYDKKNFSRDVWMEAGTAYFVNVRFSDDFDSVQYGTELSEKNKYTLSVSPLEEKTIEVSADSCTNIKSSWNESNIIKFTAPESGIYYFGVHSNDSVYLVEMNEYSRDRNNGNIRKYGQNKEVYDNIQLEEGDEIIFVADSVSKLDEYEFSFSIRRYSSSLRTLPVEADKDYYSIGNGRYEFTASETGSYVFDGFSYYNNYYIINVYDEDEWLVTEENGKYSLIAGQKYYIETESSNMFRFNIHKTESIRSTLTFDGDNKGSISGAQYRDYQFRADSSDEYWFAADSSDVRITVLDRYGNVIGGFDRATYMTRNLDAGEIYVVRVSLVNQSSSADYVLTAGKCTGVVTELELNKIIYDKTTYWANTEYRFTVPETGYYMHDVMSRGEYYFTVFSENKGEELYNHYSNGSDSRRKLWLEKGDVIKTYVDSGDEFEIALWSLPEEKKPVQTGREYFESTSYRDNSVYEFTAPEAGRYTLVFKNKGSGELYLNDSEDYVSSDKEYYGFYDLEAGEKFTLRLNSNERTVSDFSFMLVKNTEIALADSIETKGTLKDAEIADYVYTVPSDTVYFMSFNSDKPVKVYLDGEYLGYGRAFSNQKYYLSEGQISRITVIDEDANHVKANFTVLIEPAESKYKTLALDTAAEGYYTYGNFDVFRFTAPSDGEYTFWSECPKMYSDMVGELYSDAGLKDLIADDDDSGDSYRQFKIVRSLSAGETVYLKPRNISEGNNASYTVYVSKTSKDSEYIELPEHDLASYMSIGGAGDYHYSLYGDVNKDGSVTNDDYVLLESALRGLTTLDGFQLANADMDIDGTVDYNDLMTLREQINNSLT